MRNASWKDWFGGVVGFSIYIHRRGFTSSSTINHQSVLPTLPRREGAPYALARYARRTRSHQHEPHDADVLHPLVATARSGGYEAQFAPCETPPEWIGLVLKLDSLYIHRRGFTSTTTINHQSVLPTRPRREGAPGSARLERGIGRVRPTRSRDTHAPNGLAPAGWATPPCRRPSPPCCGVYPRACGGLRRGRAKAVCCSASCRVKA